GAARAKLDIDQCKKDSDCDPPATSDRADMLFGEESDGCWSNCASFAGSREYIRALKPIADDLCSEFRSKDCVVLALGCPPAGPVVWTCVDAKCVGMTP